MSKKVLLILGFCFLSLAWFTPTGTEMEPTYMSFEGATTDAYETTFAITDPTADRTITVPNADVTLGVASSITDDTVVKADLADQDWGDMTVASNVVSLDASSVAYGSELPAFVVASGANTVCSTTCGIATAIFGFDAGTSALVAISDATADSCVCNGATA